MPSSLLKVFSIVYGTMIIGISLGALVAFVQYWLFV